MIIISISKSLVLVVLILLTFLINSSYSVFLTTSYFTTSLSLLKSRDVVSNSPISNLFILFFKLLKPLGTVYQYLIYQHQILN